MYRAQLAIQLVLPGLVLVWVLAGAGSVGAQSSPTRAPNVLLIMTDDQGWGDVNCHDNPLLATPHLNQLAAEGASLQRFYVSPVCAPTRAGLLTGRYHLRTGTHGVTRGQENMRGTETTIAELFQAAGYRTGCFGKWHNGAHWPYHPNAQGFDEFVGFCAGHWNNYFSTSLEHNGEPLSTDGYIADVLTRRAIEFMEASQEVPFFCYVPLNTPHSPWQVPDDYWQRFADSGLDPQAHCAYAMCENIDDNIGRLLKCLEDSQQAAHTVVVFLTDNGPNSDRFNGNMRGRKGSVHEGGSRVPCFIRYPGVVPAGRVIEQISANLDLLPTLCELCGVAGAETLSLDGRSLVPLLTPTSTSEPWEDRSIMVFRGKGERGAVRTQRWRAVMDRRDDWALFDLQQDPTESTDLSREHPQVLQDLKEQYEAFLAEVHADQMQPLPIHLGHPQEPTVSLPGHEAFLVPDSREGISYVGKAGWANDWITQWENPQAFAYWMVDVVTSGDYQVSIEYALKSATPPALLRLEASGSVLEGEVNVVHDAPFLPSPDRIARGEVFERAWQTAAVGNVSLQPGRQKLVLKLPNADQNSTLEIKSLRLTLIAE